MVQEVYEILVGCYDFDVEYENRQLPILTKSNNWQKLCIGISIKLVILNFIKPKKESNSTNHCICPLANLFLDSAQPINRKKELHINKWVNKQMGDEIK